MSKITGAASRIVSCVLGSPALGATDDILGDTALANGETTEVSAFDGQPDVARNLTVTGNDANVSGDVVIEGLNEGGETITETIAANGANTVVGNKAFAEVSAVTLPAYDTANTERIRVGTGAKLGLPLALTRNSVVAAFLDGAREGTAPTVAVSGSALESNTATLNSALDGSEVIVDLYETL